MPKFRVQLARLVRETMTIIVDAECQGDLDEETVGEFYDRVEGGGHPEGYETESDWEPDVEWGCEEGTHTVIGPVEK